MATEIQDAVLDSTSPGRATRDVENPIREVGPELFNALLAAGSVRGQYRTSQAFAAQDHKKFRVVMNGASWPRRHAGSWGFRSSRPLTRR